MLKLFISAFLGTLGACILVDCYHTGWVGAIIGAFMIYISIKLLRSADIENTDNRDGD